MLIAKRIAEQFSLPVLSRLGVMARKLFSKIQSTYSCSPLESSRDICDLFHYFMVQQSK